MQQFANITIDHTVHEGLSLSTESKFSRFVGLGKESLQSTSRFGSPKAGGH